MTTMAITERPGQLPTRTGIEATGPDYVRGHEHQQYSTENQGEVIRQYASGEEMVMRSELHRRRQEWPKDRRRNALKQLIHDVENGQSRFQPQILEYDVSRGGAFQDDAESA